MATRLERLRDRRLDPFEKRAVMLSEAYAGLQQSDAVKWTIGAMAPIDRQYTLKTYAEAERVIAQLKSGLATACTYDFQGSVTNDTHVEAISDIDVLTLIGAFVILQLPQQPTVPYTGDPVREVLALRQEEVRVLRTRFPGVTVDDTGSKSVALSGGSLQRKVDVVPSNEFHSLEYARSRNHRDLGVQVIDKDTHVRITNFPFLHNAAIDAKDARAAGGLRRAIRLMKSLRYDADLDGISSYDICGIAYNIPDDALSAPKPYELKLVGVCLEYCQFFLNNERARDSLMVPNQTRRVFCAEGATVTGLAALTLELSKLAMDIINENKRTFTKLAEARIQY